MKKQIKNKKLKEQICKNLEGIKRYEVIWREDVEYSAIIEAKNDTEVEEKWRNGEYGKASINDAELVDDSFEIFSEE